MARTVLSLPIPSFMRSPLFPDLPKGVGFQCLGISTSVLFFYGLYNSWCALNRPTGSGWDRFFQVLDLVNSAVMTVFELYMESIVFALLVR
jgi:hypothetical protein